MTALTSLWEASLTLTAISLAAVALLVAARALSAGRARKRAALRRALLPTMLRGEDVTIEETSSSRVVAAALTMELAELVRGHDRQALLEAAETTGATRELRRMLSSRVARHRLVAAETLAMFPDHAAAVAEVALGDSNPDVRLGAALALAHEGRAPDVGKTIRALGVGKTEHSRLGVSLLRDYARRDPEPVEALLFAGDLADAAKLAATDALAESGAVNCAPLITWMAEASRDDTLLRPKIFRALGRIGHPSGEAAIRDGLASPVWPIRTSAAEAAGRSNLRELVPELGRLLADDHWWVRFRAGEALTRLGASGRQMLADIAAHGEPVASQAARTILAEMVPA